MGLLSYRLWAFIILTGATKPSSTALIPVDAPPARLRVSPSTQPHQLNSLSDRWKKKWYLSAVSIGLSLIMPEIEHLFIGLRASPWPCASSLSHDTRLPPITLILPPRTSLGELGWHGRQSSGPGVSFSVPVLVLQTRSKLKGLLGANTVAPWVPSSPAVRGV